MSIDINKETMSCEEDAIYIPNLANCDECDAFEQRLAQMSAEIEYMRSVMQKKLTAGANVTIEDDVISAKDTTYTAGENITIEDGVISSTSGGGGTPSTTLPKMDGTAAVGTETKYARGDHVHPHDTDYVEYAVDGLRRYWKFADGTLINAITVSVDAAINVAWGAVYEAPTAVSFGDWLHPFVGTVPFSAVDALSSDGVYWTAGHGNISLTNAGTVYLVSATSKTSARHVVDVFGLGRWK